MDVLHEVVPTEESTLFFRFGRTSKVVMSHQVRSVWVGDYTEWALG
jgi:hypothetical protein